MFWLFLSSLSTFITTITSPKLCFNNITFLRSSNSIQRQQAIREKEITDAKFGYQKYTESGNINAWLLNVQPVCFLTFIFKISKCRVFSLRSMMKEIKQS